MPPNRPRSRPVLAERRAPAAGSPPRGRAALRQVVAGDGADPGDVLLLLVRQPGGHAPRRVLRLDNFRQERTMLSRMRIAVIGGGPGGLYFSALAQQLAARGQDRDGHEITVWERNAADDTFGFGVVFSDETLGGIEHADPGVYARMQQEFAVWDDIDVHFKGEVVTSGGHGFAAMSRQAAAGDPAGPLPRARGHAPLPHRGARRRRAGRARTTSSSPATVSTRRSGRGTPTPSGRPSRSATASTSGWAPTRSSTPSSSTSPRRRTA